MSRNKPLAKNWEWQKQINKTEEFQSGLMLRLTVNLDTDLNLDIGEETVLNYKGIFHGKSLYNST